ncbi:MAG: hypothetical protein AAF519_07550 [Bacteroidota bacterium]
MNIKPILQTIIGISFVVPLLVTGCEKASDKEGDSVNTDKPEQTITLERAHKMLESYKERYAALTTFRDGKEDSRYGWHSLDFYENYLAYLKHESAKVGIKVSGIRLYYAAYPDDNVSGEQSGYQTYLYVPTYYNEELKKHIAFDPLHMYESGDPIPLHQIITEGIPIKKMQSTTMVMFQNEETLSSIANMGEMCPLNCPDVDDSSGNN